MDDRQIDRALLVAVREIATTTGDCVVYIPNTGAQHGAGNGKQEKATQDHDAQPSSG
jgi:hypothetical protein